jgi:predicted phosphodiesterase
MRKRKISVVCSFVKKYKKLPTLTLARMLNNKYPIMFPTMESARSMIRYVRGSMGSYNRNYARKEFIRTQKEIEDWKNHIPKPERSKFKIYNAAENITYLVLCDLHAPYHSLRELQIAIAYGREHGCNGVILNGDIIDFYQISQFTKDPKNRDIQYEIDCVGAILDSLIRALKPKKIIWKMGNHERRLENYLRRNAPELVNLNKLKTTSLFDASERGVKIVESGNPIKYKGLTILHGDEYGGSFIAPVNPARGIFLRAGDCVVIGHRHITSEHTETTINGKIITCWSIGCLCDLHPEYAPLNKWNHGFGILETGQGRFWKFHNKRIVEGEVV